MTVGDHRLVIGRVAAATVDELDEGPLVFAKGRFRTLADIGSVTMIA